MVAAVALPIVTFAGSQTYATPGSHTFTVPQNTGSITVEVWGGGGGGGYDWNENSRGGGGGGYASRTYASGALASDSGVSVIVGSGGSGKGKADLPPYFYGGTGGSSSFDGSLSASGGAGGSSRGLPSGAAGTRSGGTTNLSGQAGAAAGGNGGAGGAGANGGAGGNGATHFSGGGTAGTAPGGGGGGGYEKTFAGNAGAPGMVKITWDDASASPDTLSCSITFDTNPINQGGSTIIRWTSSLAKLFYINSVGYVGASGQATIAPSQTTDYSGYVSDSESGGNTVACPATLRVAGSTECPPDMVLVNGQCVSQQCPPGFSYQGGKCVSQCPVGYTYTNGSCVFNACPSGYVRNASGKCILSNACTTPPHCEGNNRVDSCTNETLSVCDWGCAAGACKAVPAPSATIKAIPTLLHAGRTTEVSWTSENVSSCAVQGTNGDSWTGKSSNGNTSKAIHPKPGSSPAAVDKSVIVNIIPTFNEQ